MLTVHRTVGLSVHAIDCEASTYICFVPTFESTLLGRCRSLASAWGICDALIPLMLFFIPFYRFSSPPFLYLALMVGPAYARTALVLQIA